MAKVDELTCTRVVRARARQFYEAYIANSDGLNYRGDQCPPWDDLTPAVRSHWCAVAVVAETTQIFVATPGERVFVRTPAQASSTPPLVECQCNPATASNGVCVTCGGVISG